MNRFLELQRACKKNNFTNKAMHSKHKAKVSASKNYGRLAEAKAGKTSSSNLKWAGASPTQLIFMADVYNINANIYKKRSTYVPDVPAADLAIAEGAFKMRKAAANSLKKLLAEARTTIKKESVDASIGIRSAYRSATHQFNLWEDYFPDYYNRTAKDRKEMDGGEHGKSAAKFLAAYVRKNISSPGHSNHNNGLAVDFMNKDNGAIVRNKTNAGWPDKWRKTWFWNWLVEHAAKYHFYQETTINEPWHWVYKGPSDTDKKPSSLSKIMSLINDLDQDGISRVMEFLSFANEGGAAATAADQDKIINAIATYETNRSGTAPVAKESALDTVAGVKASVKSIGQYIVSRAVSELKKHPELRSVVSPPLTVTELNQANTRISSVKLLLSKVHANRTMDPDTFIGANTSLITNSGLSNNDVKTMFKALVLLDTVKTKHREYTTYETTVTSNKYAKMKAKRKELANSIPASDRLGLGVGSLMGYIREPKNWGENKAGWYRKSLEGYEVGQRIIKAAEHNNGATMMFVDLKKQLTTLAGAHPEYTTEQLVKAVAKKHNASSAYPGKVWELYQRVNP